MLVFHYGPRMAVRFLNPTPPHVAAVPSVAVARPIAASLSPAPVRPALPAPVAPGPASAPALALVDSPPAPTNSVYCTGYAMFTQNDGVVFLSDGSSVETSTGRIQQIEKQWVIVDGVRMPIKRCTVSTAPVFRNETVTTTPNESMPIIAPMVHYHQPLGQIDVTPSVGGVH